MVSTTHHRVDVSAPRELGGGRRPVILQRDDEDFVEAVLEAVRSEQGRAGLAASIAAARASDGQTLKLFQPIQRRFHVALIEAWCDTPGKPRIDPAKVDAAGLVVRRLRGGQVIEGWMRAGGKLRGWVPVDRLGDPEADPHPAVRLARRATGNAQIDRVLAERLTETDPSLLSEHTAPMFVAPPDVCAESGRTVYYGIVQTSSSELADAEPDTAALFEGFGPGSAAFTEHLVQPLRGQAYDFPDPPNLDPNSPHYRSFESTWYPTLSSANQATPQGLAQYRFLQLLRQLAIEFDAFGTSPHSLALYAELQTITLTHGLRRGESVARTVRAGTFLKDAATVLLDRDPQAPRRVEMPLRWPALDAQSAARLAQAMSQAMHARFSAVKGRPGRYDDPDARYVLRAFVRLKAEGQCPPKTLWSDYSEPFVIAPWYEGAGHPAQIPLPDATDRNLLKSLKPNVSFLLPPKLQNLLGGDPKKMMDGELDDSGISLGWICSFSIPIITFCAFIVLNIFLSLFDLFFRWMLFIKICIPYPKFGGKS
ncbi:hypothetical protein [Methylococcus sp. EFPC2]|uniref:hypothetical protein n=1 Tax=Methylococcus sp. EFPC2 TaxID=2812648 RepID=UPI001967592F|nr:hypothetical protein [Methylococcus sp. EFPC2]QSA98398.1 hypothetical protein JWZ97_06210 [Methylococcus sp. EFPC2]